MVADARDKLGTRNKEQGLIRGKEQGLIKGKGQGSRGK